MVDAMRGKGDREGCRLRLACWAWSMLVAVAAFAAPIAAQDAGCTAVTVSPPATTDFNDGDIRSLDFTVTNPNPIPVEVQFTFSPAPDGWNWDTAGGTVALAADEAGPFSVDVQRVGGGATSAPLRFMATTNCTGPLGLGNPPTTSIRIVLTSFQAPVGPDADDGSAWPWLLLALGGVILIGGVFVVRGQAPKINAECTEPEKEVVPGRGTSFPINLANRSGKAIVVDLGVGEVPEGWSALTALPELTLAPKEERTLWLMVRAPVGAEPGETIDVLLDVAPEVGRHHELSMRATVAGAA